MKKMFKYCLLILIFIFNNCQKNGQKKSISLKFNTETRQHTSINTSKINSLIVIPKIYYIRHNGQKDSIFRYYPDSDIKDSLAVIEGLKTKVFGIGISISKKNMYFFLNDTLFFDKQEKYNPFIHVFQNDTLIPSINKLIKQHKIFIQKYRECDTDFTRLIYKGDTLVYGNIRSNSYKFIEFLKVSHPEFDFFSKFKIGMTKRNFFGLWGFNDVPLEENFTVHLWYDFDFYTGTNLWYKEYLPKLSKGKDFNGGLEQIEYSLIFINNKLTQIIGG